MSSWERAKQWNAFTRVWHLFDARWQNPFDSGRMVGHYLKGKHKPFFHPLSDCGDHVVVINTKEIALPGQEWRWRAYYHHTGYKGGASYTRAWELHDKDPTLVFSKAVYAVLGRTLQRRYLMQRLHLFPDDKIPDDIKGNISNQLRPLRLVPRTLDTYKEEELKDFPKIFDYPENYTVIGRTSRESIMTQLGIYTKVHSSRLKEQLLEECPYLQSMESTGKETLIAFKENVESTMRAFAVRNFDEDGFTLSQTAKIIRSDMFDDSRPNPEPPASLVALLEWIMYGTSTNSSDADINHISSKIAQLIVFHSLKKNKRGGARRHLQKQETDVPVYLACKLHAATRKKALIESAHELLL